MVKKEKKKREGYEVERILLWIMLAIRIYKSERAVWMYCVTYSVLYWYLLYTKSKVLSALCRWNETKSHPPHVPQVGQMPADSTHHSWSTPYQVQGRKTDRLKRANESSKQILSLNKNVSTKWLYRTTSNRDGNRINRTSVALPFPEQLGTQSSSSSSSSSSRSTAAGNSTGILFPRVSLTRDLLNVLQHFPLNGKV